MHYKFISLWFLAILLRMQSISEQTVCFWTIKNWRSVVFLTLILISSCRWTLDLWAELGLSWDSWDARLRPRRGLHPVCRRLQAALLPGRQPRLLRVGHEQESVRFCRNDLSKVRLVLPRSLHSHGKVCTLLGNLIW